MTRYIKWRKPRGGVKHAEGPKAGQGRNCMHCGKSAVHTAVRKSGPFTMDVHYCDDCKDIAKDLH